MEALTCHPLDTIKVRMQLSRRARKPGERPRSFFRVGRDIVARETPLGLYKGLGAVLVGIVPKMAIRFSSFEQYKALMARRFSSPSNPDMPSPTGVFLSGLMAGATEAVLVVTPMEVVKIRLQAQVHSLSDPLEIPKYRNAAHCAYTIVREEGPGALYRGVVLTAARQASNQAASFTTYTYLKQLISSLQPDKPTLPSYQHMLIGLVSGAMGPLSNAPIDTIKTRLQRGDPSLGAPGAMAAGTGAQKAGWRKGVEIAVELFKKEGMSAFYKGITPRIMRVAPGQAVTFAVYERVKKWLEALPAYSGAAAEFEE
ncbi:succinate-fumarate transporter [Dacryopinax primogenitus]|uniref:Succinate-fumarate transporter n=1 Tax=Dacryopinax primogenitus (strain DJM 731) TaxID=1858805 RepID=M5G0H4_DACPD|nr:succinate-fumarate transporter [Dacryopinax primogenitus]EJT97302.1 succinate-fumarate transporter [Dacryopinax primogenitus]